MKTFIIGCGIPILLFALFFGVYTQVFVPGSIRIGWRMCLVSP